jgi:hypothetical protein
VCKCADLCVRKRGSVVLDMPACSASAKNKSGMFCIPRGALMGNVHNRFLGQIDHCALFWFKLVNKI